LPEAANQLGTRAGNFRIFANAKFLLLRGTVLSLRYFETRGACQPGLGFHMNADQYVSEVEKRAADKRAIWMVLGTSMMLWAVAVVMVVTNG
jgi:hypothetical protein